MRVPSSPLLTSAAMFRLLALATLLLSCATGRRTLGAACVDVGCRAGTASVPDFFCGAMIDGPSSILCALPGRSTLVGRIMNGQIIAPLDDSSFIDARLDAD